MAIEPYTFDQARLSLNEYQNLAGKTNKGTKLFKQKPCSCGDSTCKAFEYEEVIGLYNVLAMNGEAGELAEKVKKAARDGEADPNAAVVLKAKELGDVLWYVSQAAKDLGYTLEDVAKLNLAKLACREARNAIKGSGDER